MDQRYLKVGYHVLLAAHAFAVVPESCSWWLWGTLKMKSRCPAAAAALVSWACAFEIGTWCHKQNLDFGWVSPDGWVTSPSSQCPQLLSPSDSGWVYEQEWNRTFSCITLMARDCWWPGQRCSHPPWQHSLLKYYFGLGKGLLAPQF